MGRPGARWRRPRALGLTVLQATCPLVRVAHRSVLKLVREGYYPVIIGKRDHVEVRGLTGDLGEFDVVLEDEDVFQLRPRARFGVAAQTTQPIDRVRRLVALIGRRFPASEVRFIDTVCQPTKQRQHAAVELAQRCDVIVVIGGAQQQQHARAGGELRALLPAGASRRERGRFADEWFAGVEHGGRDRRHVHAGPPHRGGGAMAGGPREHSAGHPDTASGRGVMAAAQDER